MRKEGTRVKEKKSERKRKREMWGELFMRGKTHSSWDIHSVVISPSFFFLLLIVTALARRTENVHRSSCLSGKRWNFYIFTETTAVTGSRCSSCFVNSTLFTQTTPDGSFWAEPKSRVLFFFFLFFQRLTASKCKPASRPYTQTDSAMPLVILSGLPSSGKTKRAQELKEFFERRLASQDNGTDSKTKDYRIHIVNDESLNLNKHVSYNTAADEKKARGALMSAVERLLSKDDIVIADSLNYIKGFRYQLYCVARAIGTPHCVVSFGCSGCTGTSKKRRMRKIVDRKNCESIQEDLSSPVFIYRLYPGILRVHARHGQDMEQDFTSIPRDDIRRACCAVRGARFKDKMGFALICGCPRRPQVARGRDLGCSDLEESQTTKPVDCRGQCSYFIFCMMRLLRISSASPHGLTPTFVLFPLTL